jgi:hypothetical protein
MEGVFFILIFVGVIAITALLFGVWVIMAIGKVFFRIAGSVIAPPKLPPMPNVRATSASRCTNDRCNGMNPSNARFCRRCGTALEPQRVTARRRHATAWCCW